MVSFGSGDPDVPRWCSVEPTAGGIVLTGDTKGNFLVFDGADGRVLLKKNPGDPIGGGIIAYEIDGKAFIAVSGGMKKQGDAADEHWTRLGVDLVAPAIGIALTTGKRTFTT